MDQAEFDFPTLIGAMSELAQRSLATLVPVFFALFALGFAVDYFIGDETYAGFLVSIGQFVISYFLVLGLARDAGLIGEGESGPGFASYFGLSFVMGLGTSLGYLLLFVPGIILTVRWSLAIPILFSPNDATGGRGSLGRSWDVTGPVFWKLLAAYGFGILLVVLSLCAYVFWAFEPDGSANLVGIAIANAALAANMIYVLILGFAAFLLLRNDSAELERIFA